ncbi:MAG TPA: hypothetical protein VFQ30_15850, partial [Ktedonobacteraceae bacterium]|nr:hypothetical protein [Ktedonobacteraceae bacterium]
MRKTPAARRFGALTLCVLLLTVLVYELLQGLLAARAAPAPLPSTIFLDSSAATFTISTVGSSGTFAYSVTDLSGATVRTGQVNVSYRYAVLTLPRVPDGYYVLHIVDHT